MMKFRATIYVHLTIEAEEYELAAGRLMQITNEINNVIPTDPDISLVECNPTLEKAIAKKGKEV